MPELPEVETIRAGLQTLLPGRIVESVEMHWAKSLPDYTPEAANHLIGARVTDVRRRAKMLIIELGTGYSLVIHLKMTGQMVFRGEHVRFGAGHPNDSLIGELPDSSTRVVFHFLDGSHLFFNDQRKFGWIRLLPTVEVAEIDFMKRVGPEPFDPELTPALFITRMRRHPKTTIKAALLDQTVIAGVGNIYADESLFAAQIHPAERIEKISDEALSRLLIAVRAVLRLSIEKGGSTDKNYVNAREEKGSYLEFAQVFKRQNQACPRCGTIIIKIRVAGRGTHLCPHCQKL